MITTTQRTPTPIKRAFGNRRIAFLISLLLVALTTQSLNNPSVALAHPLGNFTINRYAGIEPSPDNIKIRYALDLAEIPAFTERPIIDRDGDGLVSEVEADRYRQEKSEVLSKSLYLNIDGSRIYLAVESHELTFTPGPGGLNTMRLAIDFTARVPASVKSGGYSLEYEDKNFPKKISWKELVILPTDGLRLRNSTVPNAGISKELTEYPNDMLASPPGLLKAWARSHLDP